MNAGEAFKVDDLRQGLEEVRHLKYGQQTAAELDSQVTGIEGSLFSCPP